MNKSLKIFEKDRNLHRKLLYQNNFYFYYIIFQEIF